MTATGAAPASDPPIDYAARLERARAAAERAGAAGLAVAPGANLRWLTGLAVAPSERLVLLVLRARGEPLLLGPAFETDRLVAGTQLPLDHVPWAEREDALAVAARLLQSGEWLLEPGTPFGVATRLMERGVRVRPDGGALAALRRAKEAAEIARLARAQRITREVLAALPRRLAPGVTERELVRELVAAFEGRGAESGWAFVQFREGSALPHGDPGDRALIENSAVLVDLGAVVEGYHADLTRSWWYGDRPRPRHGEVAGAVERAQARALGAAHVGARSGDVDRAARESLESDGLARWFVHRLGHGVGLEIHEEPFLVEGSDARLAAGDVFTLEPGVYLPDVFGVRHEDVCVLGEDGVVVL